MSFLVLDRLTKTFGEHTVVDALSVSVEQGEFISLLGPSGCGKTTTLQMIAGFVGATSGAVTLEDATAEGQAGAARPGHRLPELRAVSAHDRCGERCLRSRDAGVPKPNARHGSSRR